MEDSFRRKFASSLSVVAFLALACSTDALALTVTGLKDTGLDHIYGSYAPGGNCSLEPRLTIDETGFTFRASGRTVKSTKVEYAVSYMGQSYDGIAAVFFPFPINDNNFGPVIMMVNDGEKRGVIRLEADVPPGQRQDPFHAALTRASPLLLCPGTSSAVAAPAAPEPMKQAPVAGMPIEWNNLPSLVGRFPGSYDKSNIDLFNAGAVAAAIRSSLGAKVDVLQKNLSVVSPLQRQGSLYYVSGNADHQGGVEQAYVLIDATRRAVQIGLWERGKLTVYAPTGTRIPLPADLQKLLNESPPEDAVALPGTPWEVVPVQGRSPLAYVDAAGSPNIKAFSLFCENGRPMMAVLLNKPATDATLTVTWNFAGRLVNIPVGRSNTAGTFWQANLSGSNLIPMLMSQTDAAMLRINGRLEGEALLAGAPAALRTAMKPCLRL